MRNTSPLHYPFIALVFALALDLMSRPCRESHLSTISLLLKCISQRKPHLQSKPPPSALYTNPRQSLKNTLAWLLPVVGCWILRLESCVSAAALDSRWRTKVALSSSRRGGASEGSERVRAQRCGRAGHGSGILRACCVSWMRWQLVEESKQGGEVERIRQRPRIHRTTYIQVESCISERETDCTSDVFLSREPAEPHVQQHNVRSKGSSDRE